MLSLLYFVTLLITATRPVIAQCNEIPGLGGFPSPGEIVYIPPTATCTFAEVVQAGGNCPTYTDTATLIAPGGAQFVATGTLPDNVLVTIQYPVPTPAGLMAEGIYTLSDFVSPPGAGFFAIITLTHEPVIVMTDSTSTIVTSTTIQTTTTATQTSDIFSTETPPPDVITATDSQTTTLPPATVTSTNTITPKPHTKTKRVFSTVTKTITCCRFEHPEPKHEKPCERKKHNKFCHRFDNFDDNTKNLVIREPAWDTESKHIRKRVLNPCVPQQYSLRPTATIFTDTVFSTTTVSFTSTDTFTSTTTTTFATTLATSTTTTSVTDQVTITPAAVTVFTSTTLPKVTITTTKTITITKRVRGHGYLHECDED